MNLYLYKYHEDCGRAGDLYGVFIVDERGKACLEALMESEREVDFGSVLGKHSEVSCHYTTGELVPEETSQNDVATILRVLGNPINPHGRPWSTLSGFNPLDYVGTGEEYVDCGDEESVWTYDRFLALCKGEELDEESEDEDDDEEDDEGEE